MEHSEKEKSSRKSSDKHRDREHQHEHRHHRTKDHDHDSVDRHRSDKHRHRSDRDSMERSQKRKDRGDSEDDRYEGSDKKVRVSDGVKERRKFEDTIDKEERMFDDGEAKKAKDGRRFDDGEAKTKTVKEDRRERRKFGDKVKEERDSDGVDNGKGKDLFSITMKEEEEMVNGGGSITKGTTVEPLSMALKTDPSLDPIHPLRTKVSSIYTTNDNKGVSISRSYEVPGKSSTDGTLSTASKPGNLSLDALTKAKQILKKQKEQGLAEKLKKITQLNKGTSSSLGGGVHVDSKEVFKVPSSGITGAPSSVSNIPATATPSTPSLAGLTTPNFEAVKRAQELAAKMGFRQDPEFAPLINMFPGQVSADSPYNLKPAKAPVLRLDALGREIDEHGNLVNLTKPNSLSTLKVNINKKKQDAFQLLKPELEVDPESNPHFDERMGINKGKLLRPKRMTFQFVEEGKWTKDAEILKLKSQFGEAQARELKAKQAQLAKARAEPDINPNLIEVSERIIIKEKPKDPIPEIEWWDVPLLHNGSYGDIADGIIGEDQLKMDKITIYIEHPLPIEPPAEPAPPPPQPLKLTKKELKKLRTQTRLGKEKQKQEMIRDGVIQPPKQKVKMSNLMKVLGSEATQDPTRLEMEIRSAAAEREQAHVDRNIARKSTPAERREKKERKLFDDLNTLETTVSVYKINNLSHPQNRFKVEVNAQENRLTGCAVTSDGISIVIVEGGIKSIKRYGKLMLKRINWAAAVDNNDENDEDTMQPSNKCVLAWQGSVARPNFNNFRVHNCRTEAAARKILSDAGVIHYWDLAVNAPDDEM